MTPAAPSTEQIRQSWDAIAPGFDEFVSPLTMTFGDEIVGRADIGPGTKVLDVGAGSGALAIPAARRGADVLAVDLAPAMIERLTARATTLPNLRGRVMDGQALDLDDDSFDVAVSLNGVSLFPDVDAGIAEMARVTRPGGRVAIACFARGIEYAEFIAFFVSAIRTGVPDAALPPFDPPPPPFQLADPEKLSGKLLDAGLTRVSVESANWEVTVRSATHFWDAATASNPIAVRLIAGLTAEQRADARQVLDGMLRERSHGSPMAVLHNAMNIGTGIKPRTSQ